MKKIFFVLLALTILTVSPSLFSFYTSRKMYNNALASFWKDPAVNMHMEEGEKFLEAKSYESALQEFNQVITLINKIRGIKATFLTSEKFKAYFYSGIIYQEQKKDYEKALDCYTKALEIKPNSAPAHSNLGTLYRDQKKYVDAIKEFKEAIKLIPEFEDAYKNLCITYDAQEEWEKMLEVCIKAKAIASKNKFMWLNKKIEMAKRYINTKTDIEKHALAFLEGGIYYESAEIYDIALLKYKRSIELNPNSFLVHVHLGNVFLRLNEPMKAIKEYRLALKMKPTYKIAILYLSDAHNDLGVNYEKEDKIEKAIEQYKLALKIDPSNEDAKNNLSSAYNSSAYQEIKFWKYENQFYKRYGKWWTPSASLPQAYEVLKKRSAYIGKYFQDGFPFETIHDSVYPTKGGVEFFYSHEDYGLWLIDVPFKEAKKNFKDGYWYPIMPAQGVLILGKIVGIKKSVNEYGMVFVYPVARAIAVWDTYEFYHK